MDKNSDYTSKSTQSQQVGNPKNKESTGLKLPKFFKNIIKKHKSQSNELIETRTQPDKKESLHLPRIVQQNKSKNDNSQSIQQCHSNKTEDIKANIKDSQNDLKELNERLSLNQKEIQKTIDLMEKQHRKINKLKSQIQKENVLLTSYKKKLKKLQESEQQTPEILQEIIKMNGNIIDGQEKIDNLSFSVNIMKENFKRIETKIEGLKDEERRFFEKRKSIVEVRDSFEKYYVNRKMRKIIKGSDQLKKQINEFQTIDD